MASVCLKWPTKYLNFRMIFEGIPYKTRVHLHETHCTTGLVGQSASVIHPYTFYVAYSTSIPISVLSTLCHANDFVFLWLQLSWWREHQSGWPSANSSRRWIIQLTCSFDILNLFIFKKFRNNCCRILSNVWAQFIYTNDETKNIRKERWT